MQNTSRLTDRGRCTQEETMKASNKQDKFRGTQKSKEQSVSLLTEAKETDRQIQRHWQRCTQAQTYSIRNSGTQTDR